jgi:hypothetical protein
LTDVQVPPPAPHMRCTNASTSIRIDGSPAFAKALASNHESADEDKSTIGLTLLFEIRAAEAQCGRLG